MNEYTFATALFISAGMLSFSVLAVLRRAGLNFTALWLMGGVMLLWFAADTLLIANGLIGASGMPQVTFTLALVVPVLLGLLATRLWSPLSAAVDAIPTADFLRLQHLRAVFGVLFFFTAALPGWFLWLGGLGDIAAGVGAYLALTAYRKAPEHEHRAIVRGNLAGILDFLVVLSLGVFVILPNHSADVIFSLIPLYVVPLFILLHIHSLRRLVLKSPSPRMSGNPQGV